MKNKHSNDFLKEEPIGSVVQSDKRSNSLPRRKKVSSPQTRDQIDYESEHILINSNKKQPQQGEFRNGIPYGINHQQSSNSYGFGRQYDAAKFKREMLEFSNEHVLNLYRGRIDAYW